MEAIKQLIESYLWIILASLPVFLIAVLVWNIFLQKKLNRLLRDNQILFSGKDGANLEEIILNHSKNLQSLDKDIQELYNISNKIHNLAFRGVHKVALVRFNPFGDIGGDQSSSIAMLNGKNNGVVISSLYSREGTRVYVKSIVNGISEKHPLTQEEKNAIEIAMKQKPLDMKL